MRQFTRVIVVRIARFLFLESFLSANLTFYAQWLQSMETLFFFRFQFLFSGRSRRLLNIEDGEFRYHKKYQIESSVFFLLKRFSKCQLWLFQSSLPQDMNVMEEIKCTFNISLQLHTLKHKLVVNYSNQNKRIMAF